jgi:acid phosphatase type 7
LDAPGPNVSIPPLSPAWLALVANDSDQLFFLLPSGDTVPPAQVTWSTSDSSIATIGSNGVVASRGLGRALVIARHLNLVARATIIVTDPVLVGAGDIGECASLGPAHTARVLDSVAGVVFAAGDNAYQNGTLTDYEHCYAPFWGRHLARTRPAAGNHEYLTAGAAGYFAYFGSNAGDPNKGYYSYRLGSWHVVVLNTSIPFAAGSVQQAWLREDLANNPSACAVAYWHHPRFSSGFKGSDPRLASTWDVLGEAGVDVVINGHDHHYERFALQLSDGTTNSLGIREFVVGTGGGNLYPLVTTAPHSEVRIADTFGVLKLSLLTNRYEWRFLRAPDGMVLDSGSTFCH